MVDIIYKVHIIDIVNSGFCHHLGLWGLIYKVNGPYCQPNQSIHVKKKKGKKNLKFKIKLFSTLSNADFFRISTMSDY